VSSKYPLLASEVIVRALTRGGFSPVSQKGSHLKLKKDSRTAIIPLHDEVARGTLKSILEQAGLELDEFMELL
jgi:predicted RNA binding protein YcfA (HicA-like mRNA interferase family)